MRVFLALLADLPPWQINFLHSAAANQPDGQITSDFQKSCQAPKSKIFLFSLDPNQFTDSHPLVPPEGRSRVVTSAGRDAVDVKASGAQAIAGREEPRERCAALQDDRRFLRTAKPCRSGTRCWC
jgi:hypothetical protein